MKRLSLLLLASLTLWGCSDSEDVEKYRDTHCPLTDLNPENLKTGDFVNIKVSGTKGQVQEIPRYSFTTETARSSGSGVWCNTLPFRVRVNSHGIAHDGGRWSTARPEVLPVLEFKHFEIEKMPESEK